MAREDRSAHKRKGPGRRLELFLDGAIIILCLLLIGAALRSRACTPAHGEGAPMLASTPARSLSAGTQRILISEIPCQREMRRSISEISASLPGATLPIGGGPQKTDPLANVSAIRTAPPPDSGANRVLPLLQRLGRDQLLRGPLALPLAILLRPGGKLLLSAPRAARTSSPWKCAMPRHDPGKRW